MFQRLPLSPSSDNNVMSNAAAHCINTEGTFSELNVLVPERTTWGNSKEIQQSLIMSTVDDQDR